MFQLIKKYLFNLHQLSSLLMTENCHLEKCSSETWFIEQVSRTSVAKFRKLGGNASIGGKFIHPSKNEITSTWQFYRCQITGWVIKAILSNHWPSNKSNLVLVDTKKWWKNWIACFSFWIFTRSVNPESRWFYLASSPDMASMAIPIISNSNISIWFFSYISYP